MKCRPVCFTFKAPSLTCKTSALLVRYYGISQKNFVVSSGFLMKVFIDPKPINGAYIILRKIVKNYFTHSMISFDEEARCTCCGNLPHYQC